MAKWRVAGLNFDHMHMGDLLRQVFDHNDAEIVAVCDDSRDKMATAIANFQIPDERVFTDLDGCLSTTKPDLVIVCAATADHANYVERVAKHDVHVLVEKPFAATVADAKRMIAAVESTGKRLAINWPLAWYPCHVTAKRLVGEGLIGDLVEVHYYDGNRGPLYHLADKVEVSPYEVEQQKQSSWWYKRASGGGSLLDYLGYGATLGTWYLGGEAPLEVTSVVDETPGIEVDQHSITVCRYANGLSKFETRWGTLSDPWTIQPQPKCGFVLVGNRGTLSSYDFEDYVTLQTQSQPAPVSIPVDVLPQGEGGPIEYVLRCLDEDRPITGPLSIELGLTAQRIVDTAYRSAQEKRTLPLQS